jgi:photoactive yellow protein
MLDQLDDADLDDLPFGVVCLDEALTVVRMNRTESEAAGIQRWRAIGRSFFGEVAPGPTNRALAEHVRTFLAGREAETRVAHTFVRRAGADATEIELSRGPGRVYLAIRR